MANSMGGGPSEFWLKSSANSRLLFAIDCPAASSYAPHDAGILHVPALLKDCRVRMSQPPMSENYTLNVLPRRSFGQTSRKGYGG